ncbi:MAG: cytochrome c biogenesis protein [Methyloligella sp.]|nr:MAG: cytochrome c biogenesis protein [Methyloligella sp.]
MSELYQILRIDVTASSQEVRRAYHKLALLYHPDRNLGDKVAEAKFKDVVAAFEILGDPKMRASYDMGRIDYRGKPMPRRSYEGSKEKKESPVKETTGREYTQKEQGTSSEAAKAYFDEDSVSANSRGSGSSQRREKQYRLSIDFVEACVGTTKHVRLPNKTEFKINIPAGVKSDQRLRVKSPGENGEPFVVKVRVEPHSLFVREGEDIYLDVPITPYECFFGIELDVPTIYGPAKVTIPSDARDGDEIVMKHMGLRRGFEGHGNQIVCVRVVLPNVWSDEAKSAMSDWRKHAPYNPRGKIMRLLAG